MAASNKGQPERRLPVQQMCVLVSKQCNAFALRFATYKYG